MKRAHQMPFGAVPELGNRAFGERLTTLAEPEAARAATTVLLLAPSLPLLFMGRPDPAAGRQPRSAPVAHPGPAPGWGRRLYALGVTADTWSALPAWSAVWYLREGPTQDE